MNNYYEETMCYSEDIIKHYDKLIDENNDPVHDPKPLRDYMDKWDGLTFVDQLLLNSEKTVLEIGVGTGRLGVRVAPLCKSFCGIDISPKTVERARLNLANIQNANLVCGDFLAYDFDMSFDVIYSSLTFMHIEQKQEAINKVAMLLNHGGRFVLSVDKNPSTVIDTGTNKITIYPDTPAETEKCIGCAGLNLKERIETEFADIFVADKIYLNRL